MVKRFLSACATLVLISVLSAQNLSNNALHNNNNSIDSKSITIAASDIEYWVGNGTNSAIVIVAWDQNATPTALAWGVHWNGSTTATGLLDSIVAHDSRFSYDISGSLMSSMAYNDGVLNLQPNPSYQGYWCYYQNGDWGMYAYPDCPISNNDVIEVSESCTFGMTTATAVTNPNGTGTEPDTNTVILAEDIAYWVGYGSNEVVFAVNWADTALAWGYRFREDSVMLSTVMNALAEHDPRLTIAIENGYLQDIRFATDDRFLGVSQNSWWEHTLNGNPSAGLYSYIHNGDFSRWADPVSGTVIDSTSYEWNGETYWSYIYAYPQEITPVSVPQWDDPENGPFCGAVGTDGCNAIAYNDNRIKGWATRCTIVRGSQDISNPQSTEVTHGSENDAIGAASENVMTVVSLGDGGIATLTFDNAITNGEGYDFAVYENSLNDSFLELGFVEVSSDGINYVRFPATSLTQTHTQIGGSGSVNPTFINNLAGKYRCGYGTPFDLEELRDSANVDINNITHVRIIDVVGSLDPAYGNRDAFGNIINDPFPTISYSSGFDLDGVCVLNQAVTGIDNIGTITFNVYPNPATTHILINRSTNTDNTPVTLYDITGRTVVKTIMKSGNHQLEIDTHNIEQGIYILHMGTENIKVVIQH